MKHWMATCIWLVWCGDVLAQGIPTRLITGSVREADTRDPIIGAVVTIEGTNIGAVSSADGSFIIVSVPMHDVVLSITSPGHRPASITVPLARSHVPITLDATIEERVRTEGGSLPLWRGDTANSTKVVTREELLAVPHQTIDSALRGKVAGARIQSNSGAPGGGLQVELRGVTTIAGRTDILYVVDGAIVSDVAVASAINADTRAAAGSNAWNQNNPVNRIADLTAHDIERIEVLPGGTAAALYGGEGSNGVVLITTRRGRDGPLEAHVTQRLGVSQVANKLGARVWRDEQEAIDAFGPNIDGLSLADLFVEDGNGGYIQHDHEQQIMQTRLASETNVALRGGTSKMKYLVSASVLDQPGIIIGTGYAKQNIHTALDLSPGPRLHVSLTADVIHSSTSRSVTNDDNSSVSHYMVFAFTPNFNDLRVYDDGSYPVNPFVGSLTNPLQTVAMMSDDEDVSRVIAAARASLRLWSDRDSALMLESRLGLDLFDANAFIAFPRELHFELLEDELAGTAIGDRARSRRLSGSLSLVHGHVPRSRAWRSITSLRLFVDENRLDGLRVVAEGLEPGPPGLDAAVSTQTQASRTLERDAAIGLYNELLLLDARLSLSTGFLAERNSNNGDPYRIHLYPRSSALYRVPLPEHGPVQLLRVRTAYRERGNKPPHGRKFTSLTGDNTIDGLGSIGITGVAGNLELEPERKRLLEAGVDMSAFADRAFLALTMYQQNNSGLIFPRAVAPSTGFTTQLYNSASTIRNRGVELSLTLAPVRTRDWQWRSQAVFSLERSLVTRLDVPAYTFGGFGVSLGAFRIEEGASPTQIIGNTPESDVPVKLGDTAPTFLLSLINDWSWKGVRLHTLVEWQQGSSVINLNRLLYDFGQNSRDYVDAAGQASEGTGAWRLDRWLNGDTSVYIEDATFVKLREFAISYDVPPALLTYIGAMDSARISLMGRDLLTFTGYSGLDPEVSNFGRQAIERNIDVAPFPPSRSFWVTLEAGF